MGVVTPRPGGWRQEASPLLTLSLQERGPHPPASSRAPTPPAVPTSATSRLVHNVPANPALDVAQNADRRTVFCPRTTSPLVRWAVVLAAVSAAGCGGATGPGRSDEYPLVEEAPPKRQPPITTANGAIVQLPALPTTYTVSPSPTCERTAVTVHGGDEPASASVVIPPRPGLKATALTTRTTRIDWSFRDLPADCRPVAVSVAVRNGSDPAATPTTKEVDVDGLSGRTEITYPDFLPPPDVAMVSAYSEDGHRSRAASVLIRRDANIPPDPPEPLPPVTAPAGDPYACTSVARTVDDPEGDVLTYAPGSPPAQVGAMTAELAGIDITRATVAIEGQTICATFALEQPPGEIDFEVTVTLRDASTPSCCASLRFRRTSGRVEVGYLTLTAGGRTALQPVSRAGAELRDNALIVSGTLPAPGSWPMASKRMPSVDDIGWSVTTRYFEDEYGPYFGDWLPRYAAANEPIIRHRDGMTVRPGAQP